MIPDRSSPSRVRCAASRPGTAAGRSEGRRCLKGSAHIRVEIQHKGGATLTRPQKQNYAAAKVLKKRTLTNLYNARPQWLDDAHAALDAAVASAYGWPADISDDDSLRELLALNGSRPAPGSPVMRSARRFRVASSLRSVRLLRQP